MSKPKGGWVRNDPPADLRHTVIVSREKDPLLHAHIVSLPFGQIGREMRALMNLGLKARLQARIDDDIRSLVEQETASENGAQRVAHRSPVAKPALRVGGETRGASTPKVAPAPVSRVSDPVPAPEVKAELGGVGGDLSSEDIKRINELDNLSL